MSRLWLVIGYAVLAAIGFLVGSYVVERLFW